MPNSPVAFTVQYNRDGTLTQIGLNEQNITLGVSNDLAKRNCKFKIDDVGNLTMQFIQTGCYGGKRFANQKWFEQWFRITNIKIRDTQVYCVSNKESNNPTLQIKHFAGDDVLR